MSKKKKTRRYGKWLIIIAIAVVSGLHIQPDDKELFMGSSSTGAIVKPNVVILMDNSGSMNTIIFYPKKYGMDGMEGTADDSGPDGIKGNADDNGYDPNVNYAGTIDGFVNSDTNYQETSDWYARWIVSGSAKVYDKTNLLVSGKKFWTGCYAKDSTGKNFQCGDNGKDYFRVGDKVLYRQIDSPYNVAVATLKRKYTGSNGQPWFELEDIQGETIIPNAGSDSCHFQQCPDGKNWKAAIVLLYGTEDHSQKVRYPGNYLQWVFNYATFEQRRAISYFSQYGSFVIKATPPAKQLSNCATPGHDDLSEAGAYVKQVFTRIQTAREVICKVANDNNQIVKLGLFKFNGEDGSIKQKELADMSNKSNGRLDLYKDSVWDVAATTWTPLAEALADIWYYYKPGPSSKTLWPVDYELAVLKLAGHSATDPETPIDYWCQKNYVIVMTDGESTKDGFNSDRFTTSIFKSKPVKRTEPWTSWDNGWGDPDNNDACSYRPCNYKTTATYCPNYTCWEPDDGGTDLLDDVAYFLRHQDMFPDSYFGTDMVLGWPGVQSIFTYAIGFNADNHMLQQTAVNGEGAYYTANNYEQLADAFQNVIISINLRNFAFSSITAPRKTTTATNDELTLSYVGYFMPSAAAAIWEGHLLAFELEDAWGFDEDDNGEVGPEEYVYETEEQCREAAYVGKECQRMVALSAGQEWDAAAKMPAETARSLYTHNNSTTLIPFTLASKNVLQPLFGAGTAAESEQIINKIRTPQLGDVFHSDIGFVGPPLFGKQYLNNFNPLGDNAESFSTFYENNKTRQRVIYVGTNDGILHMIYADKSSGGVEKWGFIPDAVLPSLKKIAIEGQHTYTVDGRMSAADIYYERDDCPNGNEVCWSTILVFGLRQGGNAYYGLDITEISDSPTILWKFKNDTFGGESWGKAAIGKIQLSEGGQAVDKWVAILPGGFAFNSENSANRKGKAIFVVDASDGTLLWMMGYDTTNGAADTSNSPDPEVIDTATTDNIKYLTKADIFNFCIPAACTAVDKDNNGYLDTVYFGNVGGHLFKTDISNLDKSKWATRIIFKKYIGNKAATTISSVDATAGTVTVASNQDFAVGDTVMMKTSTAYAAGYITDITDNVFTVTTNAGTFAQNSPLVVRTYDPIYLSPALAYDTCYQLWVTFGTGDRDRPRTNSAKGRFIGFKDNDSAVQHIDEGEADPDNSTLQQLNSQLWGVDDDRTVTNPAGWYFDFPNAAEKLFDPEPIIIPDDKLIPHIYFNTYHPVASYIATGDNPCNAPQEGTPMTIYDISLANCGTLADIEGDTIIGRIAGGGIYQGKEYVMYTSESGKVADVPGEEGGQFKAEPKRLPYPGGIVFWKEKKR